ncbi:MAG TPA: hypothetical protein VFI65_27560 [Streptosporangiaceae bacterium]|nr:hypothetical protein [Streptosporangiaceae bacterium]
MPPASSVSGRASSPGGRWPSFRVARALITEGPRVRGWVWWLSMLWVLMGAGGAIYALVCTFQGCTTVQCTNDEFWFPLYNGEPWLLADVGGLAAAAWILLAVPLLVAGFVRLRGWRRRSWLRATAWAGVWVAAFVLMGLVAVAGAWGADYPGLGWGELELPIFAAWLGLGALMTSVLAKAPAPRAGHAITSGRSSGQASS